MKKVFEGFLILIIFYGVYAAFSEIAAYFFPEFHVFWLIVSSLVVAALLLLLYAQIIAHAARKNLKTVVSNLQKEISEKEVEIKKATSFKEEVVKEAEKTISPQSESSSD